MSGPTISTSATRIEALQLQSSAYGVTVAKGYGVYKAAGNLVDYQNFKAIAKKTSQSAGKGGSTVENTSYTYKATIVLAIGHGQIAGVQRVWVGKKAHGSLSDVGLTLFTGGIGQAAWPAMGSINASHQIGYSGLAYVVAQDYLLTVDAGLENHLFEVVDQFAYTVAPQQPDIDPADFLQDILPNNRYGAGFGAAINLSGLSSYCRAAGILMSPYLSEQMPAADLLRKAAQLTNSGIVWSNNQLSLVPFGDAELTGNGVTYTPDNAIRYHLNDDHFCDKSEPVRQERIASSDRHNHYRIEFRNRANDYAIEIAEDKDDVDIDVNGHRPADVIQAHWICDADVAKRVCSLMLQRSLYIVNRWTFELPWHFCRLEPGKDIVTLTDAASGLDRTPVRIIEKRESVERLVFVAEDFPYGVRPGEQTSGETGGGTPVDFNADPGDVAQPYIFELPVEMSSTGLEVAVAVTGSQINWGGCRVWVSNDGTNYREIAVVFGGARYGALTATLAPAPGGALSMQLAGVGGQLLSGTQLDSERLTTLCMVKGAGANDRAEFLAYETSSLVGTNQYTLTGLVRGAYGTDQASKPAGAKFVRVDELVARSGALELDAIGRQIYFKFTSFNMVGNREQLLEDAQEYAYTITGEMVHLPPAAVTSITAVSKVFGIDLAWVIPSGAARLRATEVWSAVTNNRANATLLGQFAYPQSAHQLTGLESGHQSWFWARLVDEYGNHGEWYPSSPTAGVPGASSSDADVILGYLSGKIGETQLSEQLLERIESADGASVQVGQLATNLAAMYTVKTSMTVNGRLYMAGLGVGVENNNGQIESQVLVSADKFAIIDPSAETLTSPFVVQGGQTYINQAFIGDAWITNAMIGAEIKSANWSAESLNGWRIHKTDGLQVYSGNGARQLNLAASGTTPVLKIGSALEILASGSATFGGTLTAQAVNAVNTVNIAGNAVTIPLQGQWYGNYYQAGFHELARTPTADFQGQPVILLAQVSATWYGGAGHKKIHIYRGGSLIASTNSEDAFGDVGQEVESAVLMHIDYPPAGAHYYAVVVGTSLAYSAKIAAIGAKR